MTAYLPKLHNEIRVHCRFSTTKANASARGLEIGIVNFHQLIQVLRRKHHYVFQQSCAVSFIDGFVALRIQAVFTIQRTAHESH